MSIPAIVESAGLCDAAPVVRWTMTDRGLCARVRPTYVGTRKYVTDAGEITVLRRPSQVNSPGHLATLERLVGTRRHPSKAGRRVFLSTTAKPGTAAPWDPSVELQPHKDYFVGNVGDKIDIVHVPGMGLVPELSSTVCDPQTLLDIRNGLHEVSYGYVGFFLKAAEVPIDGDVVAIGQWKNPETGMVESFDLECLCDPTDTRIPEALRPFIGGNHLAFAVPSGRGGPDIRLLLDDVEALASQTGKPVQAFALMRKVDESGVSGTGMVAVVMTFEGGPAVSMWLTETPSGAVYADLDTFKQVHMGNHADGANELVPLTIGLPVEDSDENEQQPTGPDLEIKLGTDTGTPPRGENMENDPTKPGSGAPSDAPPPPPAAPTVESLKAQLAAKTTEYEGLLSKYNDLMKVNNDLKQQMTDAAAAKGSAMAKADSLLEELAPHRERALNGKRSAAIRALGATGTLADSINKASAVDLPGIVVTAYYEAHPNMRSVVDDLEAKLKDGAYVSARCDSILEQHAAAAATRPAAVSDEFRAALRSPAPTDNANKPKSGQSLLDSMQNGSN